MASIKDGIDKDSLVDEVIKLGTPPDNPGLIIHGGSGTKIGFGGEKYPRFVYPEQSADLKNRIRRFPLNGSEPTNIDLLKAYWDAAIKQLKIDPNEHQLLISLPATRMSDTKFNNLVKEYFFNKIGANKVAFISDPFLAMIGFIPQIKSLTGIIVDIGFTKIRIVPIYEGSVLEENIAQVSFGGFDLTIQLGSWLKGQGYDGSIDALFVRDIKENYSFVRPYKKAVKQTPDKAIDYHFGKKIFEIKDQRWKLPELLFFKKFFSQKTDFSPRSDYEGNRYDLTKLSLSILIANVIKSLNFSIWDTMCANICLTGGGSKFIGLKERLMDELKELFPNKKNKLKIRTTNQPSLMPYIGASKLSMLPSFQKYWLNKDDYIKGEYELFL